MKKIKDNEKGMVIVEATFVFPIMFLVILLMIVTGNAYLQKCRIDSIVTLSAIQGAAYCADPMLDDIEKGKIPGLKEADVRPYRYLLGGMSDIEEMIEISVDKQIRNLGTGFFAGMSPSSVTVDVKYNNYFIYSTFSVDAQCKIRLPIRMLWETEYMYMHLSSHTDMPVSDTTELIRNINLAKDYAERSGLADMIQHAKDWFKNGKED